LNGKGAIGDPPPIPQHECIEVEKILSQIKTTSPELYHRPTVCKASLFLCPITGRPCEGELAYLCEDFGCARKGGLSPRSDENF
jgi:hypothetical protein